MKLKMILWLIGLTALLAACSPQAAPDATPTFGPKSWIDAPLDGSVLPPGPAVQVTSHSADPMHIVLTELRVNGQVVQTSPNADTAQTLVLAKQQWSPPGPGNYTLTVRAQNSAGAWGEYAQAVVTIGNPTPPPTAVTPPPVVIPSATPVTKPGAPTPSPLPAAEITFYADATTLTAGQCTTIRWQVRNVSQVLLDNVIVNAIGTKQDCPNQTTTHSLRVMTLDGQAVTRTLTINVIVPSRTPTRVVPSPTRTVVPPVGCSGTPVITSFTASPSSISRGGSSTLSWGAVTNADAVEIDNGIGGVAAPGSRTVSPSVTTVYVLTARCKGATAIARVVVTVTQPTPVRQVPTSPPIRPIR